MASLQEELKKLNAQTPHAAAEIKPGAPKPPAVNIPAQVENISAERRSRASYNFIPLHDKVIEGGPIPAFDRYDLTRNTGYIDLEIIAKTPLYIRDGLTEAQYEENQGNEKQKALNADFFSPAERCSIPGSSLRGMTRNLVEILSFGKFSQVNDTRLYYRSFADSSQELQDEYKNAIIDMDEKTGQQGVSEFKCRTKVGAGYLAYAGGTYKIFRAAKLDNETQYYRVDEELLSRAKLSEKVAIKFFHPQKNREVTKPNANFEYSFQQVLFKKDPPAWQRHDKYKMKDGQKKLLHRLGLWYGKVKEIKAYEQDHAPDWHEGFLVCSGFGVNKHMQWVVCKKTDDSFEVAIDDYRNDVNREEQYDLLKRLADHNFVPCFYTEDQLSFGHTGMFRIGYRHSLKEFIPEALCSSTVIDMAESIFGFVNEKENRIGAGRVYFEDAKLATSINSSALKVEIPKTLGSPKPTTFQHYLVQSNEGEILRRDRQTNRATSVAGLKNYNSAPGETVLRGHKMYWHRLPSNWTKAPKDFKANIDTKIKPLPAGACFNGRIRFENLTDLELGALLFALDLPPKCYHKIGMGKPLGLGSIQIIPVLHLSRRKMRYTELAGEWHDEPAKENPDKAKELQGKFARHILSEPELDWDAALSRLWSMPRLRQLRIMLDWSYVEEAKNWHELTRYFEIEHAVNGNEYKDRRILPSPEEVITDKENR